jgi:hypothetical protein
VHHTQEAATYDFWVSANRLGESMRARRSRLSPEDVGPATSGARRVAGLRREEVAVLAGVSAGHCARLEQGRERSPSGRPDHVDPAPTQPVDAFPAAVAYAIDRRSEEFASLWRDDAGGLGRKTKTFHHPDAGRIELTYRTSTSRAAPGSTSSSAPPPLAAYARLRPERTAQEAPEPSSAR